MISFMKRRKGIKETNHVPCPTTAMNSGVVCLLWISWSSCWKQTPLTAITLRKPNARMFFPNKDQRALAFWHRSPGFTHPHSATQTITSVHLIELDPYQLLSCCSWDEMQRKMVICDCLLVICHILATCFLNTYQTCHDAYVSNCQKEW
jgi:hypothetical protein